ncbi:MAG TPA: sulfotransferase [Actinomycetota bacterium]|nr:sulfotransferase [Actinomycetota bacterium]
MTIDRRALRKSLRTNFQPGPRDYANRAALRARQAAHLPAYAAGRKLDRPVFVIGAPRSGTSLLYSVLRSAPQFAHWPGEAHEVWEADYHPALRGWRSNALTASDVDPKAVQRIRRAFFLVAGSRRRLIDKTPRNALRVSFVDAVFPDARYVHLVRDGRENVNSLINAWRTPRYRTYRLPHSIEGVDPQWWKFVLYPGWQSDAAGPLEVVCAKQWASSNEHALRDLAAVGDRAVRVRYEDLVDDPEGEVARVAEFLEVPFDEGLRSKAQAIRTTPVNVVTPPEPGKWRRENPREIEAIVPLIAAEMEALGYEV